MATKIRVAEAADLAGCTGVWAATVDPELSTPDTPYPLYQHLLEHGTLLVADNDGHVVGFAGSLPRDDRWFLSDFFVHPDWADSGLGRRLIDALFAYDRPGPDRVCMASTDAAALGTYIKMGMTPRWPCFYLSRQQERDSLELNAPIGLGAGGRRR